MDKKQKIALRRAKRVAGRFLRSIKPIFIGSVLSVGAWFTGAPPAAAQNVQSLKETTATLRGLYAHAEVSGQRLPPFEAVCDEINKITLEEAARDRTTYVFNAVVDSMNHKATQARQVWKDPAQKRRLVSDIMYEVGGQRRYAPSCIATCCYAVLKAFDALSDTTDILPKDGKTFGTAFLSDPMIKKYTVSVNPNTTTLQKAIEENNIQPGDLICVPRDIKKNIVLYHTVMYMGKDDQGNDLYSANNNPAVRKNIDYYNKQAQRLKRPFKIVKLNEMYTDKFLYAMQQMEESGIPKEDILVYVYSTMGTEENLLNNVVDSLNKIQELDEITPFSTPFGPLPEKDRVPITRQPEQSELEDIGDNHSNCHTEEDGNTQPSVSGSRENTRAQPAKNNTSGQKNTHKTLPPVMPARGYDV